MPAESLLIVGSGAMAGLYAARLAAHADVTMLGSWAAGLSAIQKRGIRLEEDGHRSTVRVRATAQAAECRGAALALVLVKSFQTDQAAERLAACLAPGGLAVTLQNGLGNRERLAARLGAQRVALGVTTDGATLLGPGHIRAGGRGTTTLPDDERCSGLAALLRRGGFQVARASDVDALAWGKAVVSAGINPLAALLRLPNGALLEPQRQGAWQVAAEAARETAAVAGALGLQLPFADPVERVAEVARATAANRSSMLQDIERGRPTEIDAICGAIAAEGQRLGVATPVNRVLWNLVRSLTPAPGGAA